MLAIKSPNTFAKRPTHRALVRPAAIAKSAEVKVANGADERSGDAKFTSLKPTLPQLVGEAERAERAERVKQQRRSYKFDHDFLRPFALADAPSLTDSILPYVIGRITSFIHILRNTGQTKAPADLTAPVKRVEDYKELFHDFRLIPFQPEGVPLPKIAKTPPADVDAFFAEQRIAGVNPLVLQALKPGDKRFDVLKLVPKADLPRGFDPDAELAAKNIYLCDYTGTDPLYRAPSVVVVGGKHAKGVKSLPKPLAFFWWDKKQDALVPVGIQVVASSSPDVYEPTKARVYVPNDGKDEGVFDWAFARTCVQIADANHHELYSHLGRCHFVMEPIAIATHRQLDINHPIGLLLRVHMRFIILNNALAHFTFFKDEDGTLENLMAGSFDETKKVLVSMHECWDLSTAAFPKDLELRGVGDDSTLTRYPFRDHGRLLWDATHAFVRAYVSHFYGSADLVANDTELQAWAKECVDVKEGGGVVGIPASIATADELIDILTSIIFICGPQHSAVNYAQSEFMEWSPNMPLAAYVDVNKLAQQGHAINEAQFLEMLPPFGRAQQAVETLEFLTAYKYDKFGDWNTSLNDWYDTDFKTVFATEQPILDAMETLQSALVAAEKQMEANNEKAVKAKRNPYTHLYPSRVLNSISI